MDDNTNPHPAADNNIEGLRAQYDALRHLVISILVLMIIVSGAFNLFLRAQVKYSSSDLATLRPQAAQIINEFNKRAQKMNEFVEKLREVGRTDPNFAQILERYVGPTPTNQAGLKAPVAPPPAAAPKK